jgi:hypothetical protein
MVSDVTGRLQAMSDPRSAVAGDDRHLGVYERALAAVLGERDFSTVDAAG